MTNKDLLSPCDLSAKILVQLIMAITQVLLLLFLRNSLTIALEFRNNGYSDLVISIHPDVPDDNSSLIIANIQDLIQSGSLKLFYATEGYAYIKSAIILLPTTWETSTDTSTTSAYYYQDGDVRINWPNSVYKDTPYTQQPNGCMERGEYIHLTPNYITLLKNESVEEFGPYANIFVHEWAKLRYGVFEEYGYPGDKQYPLFYYEEEFINGQSDFNLKPNFCTDTEIQGRREDIVTGGTCNFDDETNLPNANCVFKPTGDNSMIRSSLMAAPFLESTEFFCHDYPSELKHDIFKPTKHNAKCNYLPTWEIIRSNVDFQGSDFKPMNTSIPPPITTFAIFKPETGGKFVLTLDKSGSMAEKDRMERLKQSSIKWISHDLEEGNQLGIVQFE